MCTFTKDPPDDTRRGVPTTRGTLIRLTRSFDGGDGGVIRGVEIMEALTAATRAEDLADAFTWFHTRLPLHTAQALLQSMRVRCTSTYGSAPTQQGSIPVPSRAINHEVAIAVMQALYPEFEIVSSYRTLRRRTPQRQRGCHSRR